MTRWITAIGLLCLLGSCNAGGGESKDHAKETHAVRFRVQTFQVARGWGYSVFINDKEYIRQRYIPALESEIPFSSSSQALDAGNYVVGKLKCGDSPSLSRKELQQLQVLSASSQQLH